jgi:hypothetical protein
MPPGIPGRMFVGGGCSEEFVGPRLGLRTGLGGLGPGPAL